MLVVVCKGKFYTNLLIIGTNRFDVTGNGQTQLILHTNKLSADFHCLLSTRLDYLKCEFIGDSSYVEPKELEAYPMESILSYLDAVSVEILMVS